MAQAGATLDVDTRATPPAAGRLPPVGRQGARRKTELEAAEANVKRDRAAVASAQANVASAQAQLSSAMTNRDRAVIRSPVSGVVLARQVEPGQTVAASFSTPTLFVIAEDLSAMQLRVNVDEADVGQVRPGRRRPSRSMPIRAAQFPGAASSGSTSLRPTPPTHRGEHQADGHQASLGGQLRSAAARSPTPTACCARE